jgi:RNA polymerase sigma-70 factor (sigma-E family)
MRTVGAGAGANQLGATQLGGPGADQLGGAPQRGTIASVTVDGVKRGTGPGSPWDDEFARYFGARMPSLRMVAYSLCGDWHHAEDITQLALLKLYRAWPRLNHHEALDAYARTVVLRTFLNERRRPWRGREELTDALPELGTEPVGVEDRALVLNALSAMAPRQQEVLVLRYWHDLSVEETAEELGLSTGTVKSQSARGLATLRKRLGPHFPVIVSALATVVVIIVIVVGITRSPERHEPIEPAVPPETVVPSAPVSDPTSAPSSNIAPPPSR